MAAAHPTLDELADALVAARPPMRPVEYRTALALYRLLAQGAPVSDAQLATAVGLSVQASGRLWRRGPVCFETTTANVEWAVLAGFVYQRGLRLYRTRIGKDLDRDPLSAWYAVFESRLEMGVVDVDGNGSPWESGVDDAMADLVVAAHLRTESVPLGEVIDDLCAQEADLFDDTGGDRLDDALREAIAEDVHRMCDALAALGVISLEDGSVRSTTLGAWASVVLMSDDGIHVRVVGE